MPARGPRSEVFTTVLVNEQGAVADWPSHLNRLHDHGKRLRLTLPKAPPKYRQPPAVPGNSPVSPVLRQNRLGQWTTVPFGFETKPSKPSPFLPPDGTSAPTERSTGTGLHTLRRSNWQKTPVAMPPSWCTTMLSLTAIEEHRWCSMRTGLCVMASPSEGGVDGV